MPSLMGHDSDSPRSLGEVGREGVAIDTLDDMETLFQGIDVGSVSVSMTSDGTWRTTAEPTMWPIEAKLSTGMVAALTMLLAHPWVVGFRAVFQALA